MPQDKIEIVIEKYPNGSDIELDNLSLEATEILVDILKAFSKIVEFENDPNIKIGLKSGSACFSLYNTDSIYNNIMKVAENDDDRKNEYVSCLQIVQDKIKNSEFKFRAVHSKNNIETPIIDLFDKKFRLKRERKVIKHNFNIDFFKGKLYESGGKRPNFHIEQNGTKFKILCNEQQAIEVGKFLYKEVKVSAWGKLNSNNKMTYEFCDIYNANEHDYFGEFKTFIKANNSMSGTEPLKHIHYKLKEYYSEGKFNESRKFIKLFCNETTDVNRLRSILLISKPFKEKTEIKDLINTIEILIQSKTKRPIL